MAVRTRQMSKPESESDTTTTTNPASREPSAVTFSSGFLGSGKTTLLKHVLTSDQHSLPVAVTVKGMRRSTSAHARSNLHLLHAPGRPARGARNARERSECEYILIGSTAISEPMQVAETITEEFAQAMIDAANDGAMQVNKAAGGS
ncbi:hypothetical protein LTR41_011235 [Exophiala xenobiotica]|nr:hypothetical protein LTR41_011235 [Exophiala xenobiotica]KAK5550935.1 hypothetical protein LTR46_011078 [Exophiala xenobiotica]